MYENVHLHTFTYLFIPLGLELEEGTEVDVVGVDLADECGAMHLGTSQALDNEY